MELTTLMQERRSVRNYREGRIDRADLMELLSAAVLAPSWKNTETGRYVLITAPEQVEKFRATCLPGFNQSSSDHCSAYIVTSFVKGISGFRSDGTAHNTPGNEWGAYDLGLQNAYMLLKAREMGLDTLIMGIYQEAEVRAFCRIPPEEELMAVIAVGYRADRPALNKRRQPEEISRFID